MNKKFDINKIKNVSIKEEEITQSCYVGLFISPNILNIHLTVLNDDCDFIISNVDDGSTSDIINELDDFYNKLMSLMLNDKKYIECTLIIVLNKTVPHSSYLEIYNKLYNEKMKDNKLSNGIVGLLLEIKDVINTKRSNHVMLDAIYEKK